MINMLYPGFYYSDIDTTLRKRITGISFKTNNTISISDLSYLKILHFNFHGTVSNGEIICNKRIAQCLLTIFYELYKASYPIEKMFLIDDYHADDDLSCLDNNSSCFNYRMIGTTNVLSMHAYGLAIDINPFYNPYITYSNGVTHISPEGSSKYANRNTNLPYQINHNDLCYQLFMEYGFEWGGDWTYCIDYQHFELPRKEWT